jgi:hypothetical protein
MLLTQMSVRFSPDPRHVSVWAGVRRPSQATFIKNRTGTHVKLALQLNMALCLSVLTAISCHKTISKFNHHSITLHSALKRKQVTPGFQSLHWQQKISKSQETKNEQRKQAGSYETGPRSATCISAEEGRRKQKRRNGETNESGHVLPVAWTVGLDAGGSKWPRRSAVTMSL